jgi:hypothetical protein
MNPHENAKNAAAIYAMLCAGTMLVAMLIAIAIS